MRRAYREIMFSGVMLAMVPGVAMAQEEPAQKEAPAEEPAAEEGVAEEGATPAATPDIKEAPSEGAPAGTTPTPSADTPAAGAKIGPGGRPLRSDYPGTDEAMRERMETDRIQGVAAGDVSSKEVYDLRVKELETRIDDLKDQVFRSKSRIVLLKETLLGNKLAGSKALIVHKDELGKSFKLQRMTYILDGNPIRNELDRDGNLSEKKTVEIFNGAIGPGTHNLVVKLEYQGSAAVFNYFEGYNFEVSKSCKFTVEEGIATVIDVVSYRDGDVTTRIDESVAMRCDVSKTDVSATTAKP